jgi:hypothetical protein
LWHSYSSFLFFVGIALWAVWCKVVINWRQYLQISVFGVIVGFVDFGLCCHFTDRLNCLLYS